MALVVLAEGQQRSGSIGGTVWSHNRSGAYIRSRTVPVNPNTDRQADVRNAVRALAIAWQNTLTQPLRDAWETYAANVVWKNRLGQSVHLTGVNHYIRTNTPRLQNSLARIDAAPTIFDLATAELGLAAVASEATQDATIAYDDTADWCDEDGAYQYFYGGLPQNPGIKFFRSPYRLLGALAGDSITPPTSPEILAWPWPMAEGQRLWLRSRVQRADGRLSEFAQTNFLGSA